MKSLSPTEESKRFSPDLTTIEEKSDTLRPEEEATQTEPEKENGSAFFSPTVIATAFVGVALAVTAYFAPPVAIAATLALAVTGLVYYGVTAMFDFSPASTRAPDSEAPPPSTPDADNDAKNETSLSRTSSYSSIPELLPVIDVIEDSKAPDAANITPDSKLEAPLPETTSEPAATREKRSDFHDSTGSTLSNNI